MSEENRSITQNVFDALVAAQNANEMSYLGRATIVPDKFIDIAKQGATVRVGNMEGGTLQMGGNGASVRRVNVLQFIDIFNIPTGQNEQDRPSAEREVDLIADEIALALWTADFKCLNVTEVIQRNTYTKPGSVKTPTAELRILINPAGET